MSFSDHTRLYIALISTLLVATLTLLGAQLIAQPTPDQKIIIAALSIVVVSVAAIIISIVMFKCLKQNINLI
jgi:integral membrane sensor domain MASE1